MCIHFFAWLEHKSCILILEEINCYLWSSKYDMFLSNRSFDESVHWIWTVLIIFYEIQDLLDCGFSVESIGNPSISIYIVQTNYWDDELASFCLRRWETSGIWQKSFSLWSSLYSDQIHCAIFCNITHSLCLYLLFYLI